MDEVEQRIAALNRPNPSADLDERVCRVVTKVHWGLRKKAIAAVGALALLVIVVVSIDDSQPDETTKTFTDNVAPETQLVEPQIASLVLLTGDHAPLWGTNELSWHAVQD